jgi:hypothetical protein
MEQFNDPNVALGAASQAEMFSLFQQVMKDITAGHPTPSYAGGGNLGPLMYQDISGTLSIAGYKTDHIKMWPKVPRAKDNLRNTVHEYTRQSDYGADIPFYAAEGGIGPKIDVEIERLFAKCRFMSHIRRVSHPAGLINPIIGPAKDAVEKANWDASRWQLRQLERGIFFGDSAVNPDSIDGLKKAAADYGNVYDMKGQPIDTNVLYGITVDQIEKRFANPDTIWMNFTAKQDLAQAFYGHVKYDVQPGQQAQLNGGANALGLVGPEKLLKFEPNVFLAPEGALPDGAAGADEPSVPVIKTQPTAGAPGGSETSVFVDGDGGAYKYRITAFGSTGSNGGITGYSTQVESDPVTVAAGEKVTFVITKPGSNSVVFYRIERTKPGGTTFYKIKDVRQNFSGSAVADTTVTDLNEDRPDCTSMFILNHDPEIFIWQQLLGFTRIPLAMTEQTGLKQPFAFVLYGMLEVMLPSKIFVVKNVGREVTAS